MESLKTVLLRGEGYQVLGALGKLPSLLGVGDSWSALDDDGGYSGLCGLIVLAAHSYRPMRRLMLIQRAPLSKGEREELEVAQPGRSSGDTASAHRKWKRHQDLGYCGYRVTVSVNDEVLVSKQEWSRLNTKKRGVWLFHRGFRFDCVGEGLRVKCVSPVLAEIRLAYEKYVVHSEYIPKHMSVTLPRGGAQFDLAHASFGFPLHPVPAKRGSVRVRGVARIHFAELEETPSMVMDFTAMSDKDMDGIVDEYTKDHEGDEDDTAGRYDKEVDYGEEDGIPNNDNY